MYANAYNGNLYSSEYIIDMYSNACISSESGCESGRLTKMAKCTVTAPLIIWLRVGNATNRALRTWIEPRLPGIVGLVAEGHRLIEVR